MKLRIALILSLLASLVGVFGLATWLARYTFLSPVFYQRWLRESDFVTQAGAALAVDLPRQIPAELWSPWISREPETLRALFDAALATVNVEATVMRLGPAWTAWALGEAPPPERMTPDVEQYLTSAQGELVRDWLWRALPSCEEADPPYCIPLDPGAHSAVGQQQQAWWQGFVADFTATFAEAETDFIAVWPGPPSWLSWVWYVPLLALALALIATLLVPDRKRWVCLSVPLLTSGLIVGVVGVLAMLELIQPPDIRALSGQPFSAATVNLFATSWYALMRVIGPTFLIGGMLALALGLTWLVLIFEGWPAKIVTVVVVLLALWGVAQFYPVSVFAPLTTVHPALAVGATPTPWPTFTSTPTLTPTPYYWPVAAGTPAPTPSGSFTMDARLLGCYQTAPEPILALDAAGSEVHALQSTTTSRHSFPALAQVARVANAPIVAASQPSVFALSDVGGQIAVAHGHDLYVYAFPSWTRVLRSRVSTFSRIQTLAYISREKALLEESVLLEGELVLSEKLLVLGLENGYLWVVTPETGRLVWLLSAPESPVTALAAHPTQPWVLSGAVDGVVRLWDMAQGTEIAAFEGHAAAVRFIAFAPQGNYALSVDEVGQWIVWNVVKGTKVRQRRPALDGALSALLWTDNLILGGTTAGDLLFADANLTMHRLRVTEEAITSIALDASGAALIGSASGEVCVWGVLDLP
ncbi:MAG: WD40 repeat domain-containing protein [Anaerolineae bacterium]